MLLNLTSGIQGTNELISVVLKLKTEKLPEFPKKHWHWLFTYNHSFSYLLVDTSFTNIGQIAVLDRTS